MWFLFRVVCDLQKQRHIHRLLRESVLRWFADQEIQGAVMTYHFDPDAHPRKRSLYVALKIDAVENPVERTRFLSSDIISKIPENQMAKIVTVCRSARVDVSLQVRDASAFDTDDFLTTEDYFFLVSQTNPTNSGAIIATESVQTIAALEILLEIHKKGRVWTTDNALRLAVEKKISNLAGKNASIMIPTLHYACNCLGLSGLDEQYFVSGKGTDIAVERLYTLEGVP